MNRRRQIRSAASVQFRYYKVDPKLKDPNHHLPPGHYPGDGHGGGHHVGDGHNHGGGPKETHGHSEGDGHVHGGEEHAHAHDHFEHAHENQGSHSHRDLLACCSGGRHGQESGTLHRSAQNETSQNPRTTNNRQALSSQSSDAQSIPVKKENAPTGKQGLIKDSHSSSTPNAASTPQTQTKSGQGEYSNQAGTALLLKNGVVLQTGQGKNLGEISTKGTPPNFFSLISGKISNLFLQSLSPEIRSSFSFIQGQAFTSASPQTLSNNLATLQALFKLSSPALFKALQEIEIKGSGINPAISENAEVLGFQAYIPLAQTGLRFALPHFLQSTQEVFNQFSNLLFGNYLLKLPPAAIERELLMQQLALLYMNESHRKKKKKKEEVKKVKKKEALQNLDELSKEKENREKFSEEEAYLFHLNRSALI